MPKPDNTLPGPGSPRPDQSLPEVEREPRTEEDKLLPPEQRPRYAGPGEDAAKDMAAVKREAAADEKAAEVERAKAEKKAENDAEDKTRK